MSIVFLIIIAFIAYVFGSINTLSAASIFIFRFNLHKLGKGSIWLSTFRRKYGMNGLLKIIVLEIVKDIFPILIGGWLMGTKDYALLGKAFAGFCLVLGNLFPVFNRFKGEHAIFPAVVTTFCLNAPAGIIVLLSLCVSLWLHRFITVSAIVTGAAVAVSGVLVLDDPMPTRLCAFIFALIFIRHIPGIYNILRGREERLSLKEDLNYKFDENFNN